MPADSIGNPFLWVNRDAETFKSRDQKRVSKSYVQRAKHLKEWKHSKLRSSVSKKYFPWSFRPEGISFGSSPSGNTRLPLGVEDASNFTTGTQQPVSWSYPMIGPGAYEPSVAKHPFEITAGIPTSREMRPQESAWFPQMYDYANVVGTLSSSGEAVLGTEAYSNMASCPTPFEHDSHHLPIGFQTEATDGCFGGWDSVNPSRIYPQACLCQYRQPKSDRKSEVLRRQSGADKSHADVSHDLERIVSCPSCGRMPLQATDLYTTMRTSNDIRPDLDSLHTHSEQTNNGILASQQVRTSTGTSFGAENGHYFPWDHEHAWEHCHPYTG